LARVSSSFTFWAFTLGCTASTMGMWMAMVTGAKLVTGS
jgi:hypothetical protein